MIDQVIDCVSVYPTVTLLQLEEESACLVEGEEAESTSAVRPNRRHPVALWGGALDSLDFLENRLLPEDRNTG